MADDFRRILVVATRLIGDVLLTTPLISAAQRRWPTARIDVLGFAGTLGVLRGNPGVHSLIEVQAGAGGLSYLPLAALWWKSNDPGADHPTVGDGLTSTAGSRPGRAAASCDRAAVSWWKLRLLRAR